MKTKRQNLLSAEFLTVLVSNSTFKVVCQNENMIQSVDLLLKVFTSLFVTRLWNTMAL